MSKLSPTPKWNRSTDARPTNPHPAAVGHPPREMGSTLSRAVKACGGK